MRCRSGRTVCPQHQRRNSHSRLSPPTSSMSVHTSSSHQHKARLILAHLSGHSQGNTTTTDVYWYTIHVSSSASIHGQFYETLTSSGDTSPACTATLPPPPPPEPASDSPPTARTVPSPLTLQASIRMLPPDPPPPPVLLRPQPQPPTHTTSHSSARVHHTILHIPPQATDATCQLPHGHSQRDIHDAVPVIRAGRQALSSIR
jgi:hypothetical protein